MKKTVLLFVLAVMCGLVTNAATKYEINIAGTEVTSDNASYIGASSENEIESGYAVYNASSNTLTCYNLRIYRTGTGSYGIHNRKCDDLKIVFKGECYIATADHALNLARGTVLYADEGSYTTVFTGGDRHAINLGSYSYGIQGTGTFNLSGKASIHGNGSGSTTVSFLDAKVTSSDNKSHAFESFKADFYDDADVRIKSNGSSTSVNDVKITLYWDQALLEPYGAYYKDGTVYNLSGSAITNQDIYISDNYVAIINADYFPDANFRSALLNLYPKGYLTSNDTGSRTSLDVSGYGIADLTGVNYFYKLTTLNCNNNNLTSLPKLPSTLKELYCNNNKFTSLDVSGCSALKILCCQNNQLTSLPSSSLPLSIEEIYCASNKFTTLQITGKSNLKTLDCRSNTSLTRLECRQNALTTLSLSGCTALTELYCNVNKLTSLSLSGLNALSLVQLNGNQIKKTEMGDLINSLRTIPAGSTGQIYVLARNSQSEGNEITTEQVKIARNKRWIPYHLNNNKWEEIPGGLKGDVNGDGKVNVSDVTALINMIMGITTMDESVADVNGDGKVNVSDVSALINIILGIS